jgi:hypothetical protein
VAQMIIGQPMLHREILFEKGGGEKKKRKEKE